MNAVYPGSLGFGVAPFKGVVPLSPAGMSTRREYLRTVAGSTVVGSALLAGCTGSGGTGTLATRVSDQPGAISDFESCVVTISEVRVKPTDGELVTKEVEETDADLTELQGEASALVDEVDVETGEYEYLQLGISGTEATLQDGSSATVEVPGEAPLKFEKSFEIRADERTVFTADFTPVRAGASGRYVLQPVADEVTVTYEGANATTTQGSTTSG